MTAEIKVSSANDYQKIVVGNSMYKERQILPLASVTPTLTSNTQAVFELPSQTVYNLAQSLLVFTETIPQGATGFAKNIQAIPLLGFNLQTEKGVLLGEVNDLQPYLKVVNPLATPADEAWRSKPMWSSEAGTDLFYPATSSTALYALADGSSANPLPHPMAPLQYFNTTVDTASVVNWQIPFSNFKHTALALDKDMFWGGEKLILTLTFAPQQSYAHESKSDTNMITNAQALQLANTISNLSIQLAEQHSQGIVEQVKSQVRNAGISINFQFPSIAKMTTDNSGTFSYVHRLNIAKGSAVQRIYHALYRNSGSASPIKFNLYNGGGSLWSSVRTAINSQYDQDSLQNPRAFYRSHNELFEKSVAGEYNTWVYTNSAVCIDYCGQKYAESDSQNIHGGLDLKEPQEILVDYTKAAEALNYMGIAVCSRTLNLSSAGVSVTV